jgi:copper resistance protein C
MVMKRRIVAAAVFAAAVAFEARSGNAHAFLDHSVPAVGSSLPSAPASVTMWFTQQLEPAFTNAMVTDKSGNRVDQGDGQVDPKDPTELRILLKPVPPGTYTVAWHALSVDTHTTQGHFNFEVGAK